MNLSPKALAEQVRAFVSGRRDTRADLIRKKQGIDARREELLALPLSRADVQQFIFDYIDARAADYPHLAGWPALFESVAYPMRYGWQSQASIVPATGKRAPLCLRDVHNALNGTPSEQGAVFDDGLNFFGTGHAVNLRSDLAAYFFFGDLIKARIAEHFDAFFPGYCAHDEARIGPPMIERQAELARLALASGEIADALARVDAELAELEPPREVPKPSPAPATKVDSATVPQEAILAYDGRNENALAKKFGCSASAIVSAFHRAEAQRRATIFSGAAR